MCRISKKRYDKARFALALPNAIQLFGKFLGYTRAIKGGVNDKQIRHDTMIKVFNKKRGFWTSKTPIIVVSVPNLDMATRGDFQAYMHV